MLKDKKILIGITGGISAYKVNFLIRDLRKMGAEVRVILTESGKQFISIVTLEAISNSEVYSELFVKAKGDFIPHIDLLKWADCLLICPATANFIAKAVLGLADDLLSTLFIAYDKKAIFVPSMHNTMYLNPIVQENIKKLHDRGHIIIEPETGELASGDIGVGRLPEIEKIIHYIKKYFVCRDELKNKKILVTAGRTEEPIDPIRFISNYSTGKMGFSIAEEAVMRGADVTLISGPTSLKPPFEVKYIQIKTAKDMAKSVKEEFLQTDVLIMTSAVSDYKPVKFSKNKIKKGKEKFQIELIENEDILESISKIKNDKIIVGFSLETENEISNSIQKLKKKNLDFMVVNNPLIEGAGFGVDTNVVKIIDKDENVEDLPKLYKSEVANIIIDKVIKIINERK